MTDITDRTERQTGENWMHETIDNFEPSYTGYGGAEKVTGLPIAQITALRALYYETRHGNDQIAEHTAALKAHTKALNDNTSMMFDLYGALQANSDPLGKPKPR
ncbi:hypothetical protein ACTG9Q_28620 [Actinokineospora sp. 24-640]